MKVVVAASAALAALAATSVQAQIAPDALIKTVATDVTTVLKADPAILGNAAKLKELIENKLIPNFSFARMTQLAMGRNWAKATPEQQAALTKEFQTLLVRTYSGGVKEGSYPIAILIDENTAVEFAVVPVQRHDAPLLTRSLRRVPEIEEVVADKGYHSNQVLVDLAALDLRSYIAEPARGPIDGRAH